MRWVFPGLLLFLGTGCLALETREDGMRVGAKPDPEQSGLNRLLFGTRYILVLPPLQGYRFDTAPADTAEKPAAQR
jgi:hypothetical protein